MGIVLVTRARYVRVSLASRKDRGSWEGVGVKERRLGKMKQSSRSNGDILREVALFSFFRRAGSEPGSEESRRLPVRETGSCSSCAGSGASGSPRRGGWIIGCWCGVVSYGRKGRGVVSGRVVVVVGSRVGRGSES